MSATPTPPGGGATAVEVRVRYAETDRQGVAYHGHYFVWMEIGRTEHLAAVGHPYDAMEAAGVYFAVTAASCRYRGAAGYEDRVRIETRVVSVRSRSVEFAYDLSVAGRPIAEGRTTLVCMDADRSPRRIPRAVVDALGGGAT